MCSQLGRAPERNRVQLPRPRVPDMRGHGRNGERRATRPAETAFNGRGSPESRHRGPALCYPTNARGRLGKVRRPSHHFRALDSVESRCSTIRRMPTCASERRARAPLESDSAFRSQIRSAPISANDERRPHIWSATRAAYLGHPDGRRR